MVNGNMPGCNDNGRREIKLNHHRNMSGLGFQLCNFLYYSGNYSGIWNVNEVTFWSHQHAGERTSKFPVSIDSDQAEKSFLFRQWAEKNRWRQQNKKTYQSTWHCKSRTTSHQKSHVRLHLKVFIWMSAKNSDTTLLIYEKHPRCQCGKHESAQANAKTISSNRNGNKAGLVCKRTVTIGIKC